MQKTLFLLAFFLPCSFAMAVDLSVSSNSTIIVTAPADWRAFPTIKPGPAAPAGSYRVVPPLPRNLVCIVSILDRNNPQFTNASFLRRYLMLAGSQYVDSPTNISKIQIKELKVKDGLGFYANFIDSDLAGKTGQPGQHKAATPVIIGLGTNYLVKVTIFSDDPDDRDHYEAIKAIESIRLHKK